MRSVVEFGGRVVSEAVTLQNGGALEAPWTGVTLVDLFLSTVRMNGQSAALCGPSPDGPVTLTFSRADLLVQRIVERLEELVIEPGAPVAVAMPCVPEAPLALLAVLQAGFMPCLLPVHLDPTTLGKALAACGAKAVITLASIGALRPAELIRSACVFQDAPRYLLAFGERLPGGVIPLDGLVYRAHDTAVRARPPAPRFAVSPILTLSTGPGPHHWTRQDQEGLVAMALTMVLKAGIASGEAVLTTLAPVTAAALSTGLVPALLTGGTLHLNGLFSAQTFVADIEEAGRPHIVVPAALEGALARSGLLDGDDVASATFLHRPPVRLDRPPQAAKGTPLIDGLALGEHGLLLSRRSPGAGAAVGLGDMRLPDEVEGALVLAARRLGSGEVEVAGAAAGILLNPRPRLTETEWTETGIAVDCDDDGLILAASPL